MQFTKSMKVASMVGTGTILVGSAGVAVAMWSATGGGGASATAYTAKEIVATAVVSPGEDDTLYPNGPGTDVHFTFSNNNPYPVTFTGWKAASVTGVSGGNGCAVGDFTIPTAGDQDYSLDALQQDKVGVLSGALKMNDVSGTTCQGAAVTVTFTLDGGTQTS